MHTSGDIQVLILSRDGVIVRQPLRLGLGICASLLLFSPQMQQSALLLPILQGTNQIGQKSNNGPMESLAL